MPDLSSQILPRIRNHRIEGLSLDGDLILPYYDGLSLVNIPGTIAQLLGAPGFGRQPLDEDLTASLDEAYEKVVLILVDAMGLDFFQRELAGNQNLFWGNYFEQAVFSPITSICPSTTASALSSLWTGVGAGAHGIIGYEMWAKEFGMIINNIQHSAASARGDIGGLSRSGFEPAAFISSPLFGTYLRSKSIQPTTFIHSRIANSGLSLMQMANVDLHTFVDEADLCIGLANHINSQRGVKEYIYVYYSDVDTLMHRYSDENERVSLQFEAFSRMLEQALQSKLSKSAAENVLLILTADHGSKTTPIYSRYDLANHPALLDNLVMQPTCENRLAFLYIKPGRIDAVRSYFKKTWPKKFVLLNPEVALESGLFGQGPFVENILDRLGNLIVVAKDDAYLWWAPKPNPMAGRHGGLSKAEMLVPFYALPLKSVIS